MSFWCGLRIGPRLSLGLSVMLSHFPPEASAPSAKSFSDWTLLTEYAELVSRVAMRLGSSSSI